MNETTLVAIGNELRTIEKLCRPGSHENIVSVFESGKLKSSSCFFIDMELCDLSLADYMQGRQTEDLKMKAVAPDNLSQIWDIMEAIANGLTFIHSLNEAHRDLKPSNGRSMTSLDDID